MKRILLISLIIIPLLATAQQQGYRSAQFPEGDFLEWIWQRVEYPKAALDDKITGVCVVSFSITADGELKSPYVTKSPHWSMNEELIRVMKMSPGWTPAIKNGIITTEKLTLKFDMSSKLTEQQLAQMRVVELYKYPTYSQATNLSKSINKFKSELEQTIVIPKELSEKDINTTVDIKFIIDTLGAIKELSVKGENELLNNVVMNTIEQHNKGWSPATVDAQPLAVPVTFSLPLTIENGVLQQAPATDPEQMPKFQGGNLMNFRDWVASKIKYPNELIKEKVSGRVVVGFIVEKNGAISEITTVSTPHKLLTAEVVRVLEIAPRWTPGKQAGKPVRVRYTLPINFKL